MKGSVSELTWVRCNTVFSVYKNCAGKCLFLANFLKGSYY